LHSISHGSFSDDLSASPRVGNARQDRAANADGARAVPLATLRPAAKLAPVASSALGGEVTMFQACGKEVLRDREHYADAVSEEAANAIAAALNREGEYIDERDASTYEIPFPLRHSVRQENDEFACSCGRRWEVSEGIDHP
jgi:hypothetical protein